MGDKIPEDCPLMPKCVPPIIWRSLVDTLNENNNWKTVANNLAMKDVLLLDDVASMGRRANPAESLLYELESRMCDVGTLCLFLEECNLHDALLLFRSRVLREPLLDDVSWHNYILFVEESPAIVQQPFGRGDGNSCMVKRDKSLHLTCKASGLPPPIYQWCKNGDDLDGCVESDLIIHNFSLEDEGDYYCLVLQEGFGTLMSDVVPVTLAPEHPFIENQTSRQLVCRLGASLVISVRAKGHPRLSYQWYHDSRQLDDCTEPDLNLERVTNNEEGDYRCYIRNSAGEVWSAPSRVTVYVSPEDVNELGPRPTASAKVALLIANQHYENMSPLCTPIEDVRTLAEILVEQDFQVLALLNLSLIEMKNAIRELCKILTKNAYVVFYFAGHGFKMKDKFMLPVSAPEPDAYLMKDAVSESELLKYVLDTHPQVFLELLDMCLKSPEPENKAIYQEVVEPVLEHKTNNNLIQGYSTTSYLSAYERKTEKNGLFVKFLKKYLIQDKTMVNILENVARDMEKECAKQMPYRGTNVTKDYRLNDACSRCDDVKRKVELLKKEPEIQIIKLEPSNIQSVVTCSPYQGFYSNALQVAFTNLQDYDVTCVTDNPHLVLHQDRLDNEFIITIMNLQKLRKSEDITLNLKSKIDGSIEYAKWKLGKPMIAVANLWEDDECT